MNPFDTVLYTKDQLLHALEALERMQSTVGSSGIDWPDYLTTLFPIDQKAALFKYLETDTIESIPINQLHQRLQDLTKYLESLPTVSLILSFAPRESALHQWSDWFQKHSQKVIFDIHLNPHIIGGAEISFEGKYHDYTLETKVHQLLSEQGYE